MEFRQLLYLDKVAELGSITRASARLGIAQPALSRQISRLEAEVGTKLLVRHGRGATPTEAGTALLRHAREILDHLAMAEVELSAHRTAPGGHVSIGMTPAMATILGPHLVQRFRETFPNVVVSFAEGFGGYLHDWLVEGRIDAALVYEPLASRLLLSEELVREDLMIIGPAGDTALSRRSVPFRALARLPLALPRKGHSLRSLVEGIAAREQIRLDVVVEIDSMASLLEMVRRGIGYTVLGSGPIEAAVRSDEFAGSRIKSPTVTRRLTLTTSAQRPLGPPARTLIGLVRPVLRHLVRCGTWSGSLAD